MSTDDTLPPDTRAPVSTQDTLPAEGSSKPPPIELPAVDRAHYQVGAELARGGMGRIMVARDRRMQRPVALKELLADGDSLRLRFEREALVTGRLQHPGIVPVYEAGRWPTGEPFYAMKLVSGQPLEKVIGEQRTFADRLALLPNVIHVAEAIAYAHGESVIHRDLKPANVLCGAFGETVVIDWGLAKDLRDTAAPEVAAGPYRATTSGALTVVGSVMGTPIYMPPEQANGDPVDERADVYALGAILYHVLAGAPPYTGRTAEEILAAVAAGPPAPIARVAPDTPPELATIVGKAMQRRPGDRYRTAKELAEELVRFQAGQLVSAHRYTLWAHMRRAIRRHRAAVIATCALVVLGAVIAAISVRQIVKARDRATSALARAHAERRAFLEEQGRLELLAGHEPRAAVYLAEAYAGGPPDDALRLMLARAMQPLDALEAIVDSGPVTQIVPSPDGARVATIGAGRASLWTADGAPIAKLEGAWRSIVAIAWSRDGARLAVIGSGEPVMIFDAHDGRRVATLATDIGAGSLLFSADGRRVFYADFASLRAFDAESGALIAKVEAHLELLAITTDGTTLVADGEEAWSTRDAGTLAETSRHPHAGKGASDAASSDGARIAVETDAGAAVFATAGAGDKPIATIASGANTDRIYLDHGGDRALTLDETRGASVQALAGGDAHVLMAAQVAAIAPDGSRVAAAGEDGTIWIFDHDGAPLARLPGHRRTLRALAFDPTGTRLYSGGEEGVRVWRAPAADPSRVRLELSSYLVDDGVTADGSALVTLGGAGDPITDAVIRDAQTGKAITTLGGTEPLWSASITPDGARVATSSTLGHVTIWDARAAKKLATIDTIAFAARWSPDGTRLVTCGERDAILWDAQTGAQLRAFPGVDELVTSARFSADGARVVTAAHDGVARVYDASTGALELTLAGHADYLIDAAFDPRGERLVTASADGTARLWDAASGAQLAILGGHTTAVVAATFTPDGARVITGGADETRVWDAATGKLLVTLAGGDARLAGPGLIALGDDLWDATRGVPLLALDLPEPPQANRPPRVAIGQPYQPIHDPRQMRPAFAIDPNGAWIARPDVVVRLARENRSPEEISAIVLAKSGWREQDGALVPAEGAVGRTQERADSRAFETTYDFSGDQITGEASVPPPIDLVVPVPPGSLPPSLDMRVTDDTMRVRQELIRAYLPILRHAADAPGASEDDLVRAVAVERGWGDLDHEIADDDRLISRFGGGPHGDEYKIRRAFLAITAARGGVEVARRMIAGVADSPAVDAQSLYQLARVKEALGDEPAAYRGLLAAAASWRGSGNGLRGEIFRLAARRRLAPDDVLGAVAGTKVVTGKSRADLLSELAQRYDQDGEIELEEQTLTALATDAPPALLLWTRGQQARLALAAGRTRDVTTHELEELAIADAHPELEDHDGAVQDVSDTARLCHATYVKTMDERYGRVALALYTAYLTRPRADGKETAEYAQDLAYMIGQGPTRVGTLDKSILRRAFRERLTGLEHCYADALSANPALAGEVRLRLVIVASRLVDVTVDPPPGPTGLGTVSGCLRDEARKIILPRAEFSGTMLINYPLELHPDAGG
jgi:WD40 repeat protein